MTAAAWARGAGGRIARWAVPALWIAGVLWAHSALAAQPGTTSQQSRQDSIHLIPLAKLDSQQRAKVQQLTSDGSIFRRMPTQSIECDPRFYAFLVEHPEVIVNIWSVLGISDVKIKRTSDTTFDANDGAGTLGKVEFLYRSRDTHLLYGEGTYEGRLFTKKVRGRCLLLLKTAYLRQANGNYFITCRLDAFMQLDNVGVDMLAKTFQPFVGQVADHNFRETTGFVESLYRAAEINYSGMQALSQKLALVQPEVRDEFASVSEQVAIKAALTATESLAKQQAAKTARRNPPPAVK
jgi:hypothetical protein